MPSNQKHRQEFRNLLPMERLFLDSDYRNSKYRVIENTALQSDTDSPGVGRPVSVRPSGDRLLITPGSN